MNMAVSTALVFVALSAAPEDDRREVGVVVGERLGTEFNWYPRGVVNDQTNLYYAETRDFGQTWQAAEPSNPSACRLYCCDRAAETVWRLPEHIEGETAAPQQIAIP